MALMNGHRFAVTMADVFPHGLYARGVDQAMDFNEKTRARTPAKDKVTGELVWTVTCIDRDPEARALEVRVKVTGRHAPALPGEVLPGSGLSAVEFTGLTVTPYVEDGRGGGRSRLAFSFRATEVWEQGKAPAELTGRSVGARVQGGTGTAPAPAGAAGVAGRPSGSGDGKAA